MNIFILFITQISLVAFAAAVGIGVAGFLAGGLVGLMTSDYPEHSFSGSQRLRDAGYFGARFAIVGSGAIAAVWVAGLVVCGILGLFGVRM